MKQSFDAYSILSLIIRTAAPLIVAALVRYCYLEQFKRCCLRKIGETQNAQNDIPTFPQDNFFPMATQSPKDKIKCNQQQAFLMNHLTTLQI